MRRFFEFFIERHMLANVFILLVAALGIASLLRIKRDVFPDVDFGEMTITTRYPGASPRDVELNVTNEIEDEIEGVSGIEDITSYSMENISIIVVTIDVDADDKDDTKDDVREAVARVTDLPREADAPEITELSNEEVPIIEVGVSGDIPYRELREAARLFRKKLEDVPGVSRVNEFWYLDREVRIEVSPGAIEEYQIPLAAVADAVRGRNIRSTAGSFESYASERNLVTMAQFERPGDVADAIVRSTFTSPLIRVSDIAVIEDGFEEPRIITRIDGRPAITFQVLKKEEADIIRTVDAIKRLADREEDNLPEGVEILFSDNSSYYVRNRFGVVINNGIIGLVLVLLLLAAFLNLRTALWVAVSIPVILLGVVFLMPLTGTYLDIISLTAMLIVIGIIVDDGIIISENMVKHRERGEDPAEAASRGIAEVFKPVLTTLLTTFLAFAPMFFMTGIVGEFVRIIPLVISLALLMSLLEVVIALPAHIKGGLHRIDPGKKRTRAWFEPAEGAFNRVIESVLRKRYLFIAVSVALFAAAVYYAACCLDPVLFPGSAADRFSIYIDLEEGASLEKTADEVKRIEALIEEIPDSEIDSYATRIGSHGDLYPGESESWAMVRVNLVPYAERERTADQIVEELKENTSGMEAFEEIVYEIDRGGPPVGSPVVIRIIGAEDSLRRSLTDSVVAYIGSIEGVKNIDRNDDLGREQVRIRPDYERLSRLGLTVADIARTARIAYDGQIVTDVRYGEDDVEFRVILEDSFRASADLLPELRVLNPRGRLIPIGEFATLTAEPGPSNYFHFDGERTTRVTADTDEEVITPVQVTAKVTERFDTGDDWPGMRFSIGGEAQETTESFESLYLAFAVAVVAIYFLLVLLFQSVTQPLVVVIAIPFGVIAVVAAFAIHGKTPGFLAMMGLVGLSGVVVNDSLVMVDHINRLRRKDPDGDLLDVIARGATDRLRAVIMTTLTTAAGLIPLAYGIGGSDPFIAPLPLALGYGLLFATPLTLALVPCFYMVRDDILGLVGRIRNRLSNA